MVGGGGIEGGGGRRVGRGCNEPCMAKVGVDAVGLEAFEGASWEGHCSMEEPIDDAGMGDLVRGTSEADSPEEHFGSDVAALAESSAVEGLGQMESGIAASAEGKVGSENVDQSCLG